jgi:hypothetical protein
MDDVNSTNFVFFFSFFFFVVWNFAVVGKQSKIKRKFEGRLLVLETTELELIYRETERLKERNRK